MPTLFLAIFNKTLINNKKKLRKFMEKVDTDVGLLYNQSCNVIIL